MSETSEKPTPRPGALAALSPENESGGGVVAPRWIAFGDVTPQQGANPLLHSGVVVGPRPMWAYNYIERPIPFPSGTPRFGHAWQYTADTPAVLRCLNCGEEARDAIVTLPSGGVVIRPPETDCPTPPQPNR